MQTKFIIFLLCGFGFFKEFRPSEPFISPFLNGPKNLTASEINNDIFPIGTYSTMSLLIIVFLLTDWLRYKPVLIVEGICGIITWSILAWGHGLAMMQLSQVTYGLYSASDVAYSSYLYAKIDKKQYQRATGHTRAATLVSKAGSGLVSQILIMYYILDYEQLNFLTLASMFLATIIAFLLPSVPYSSFFNRADRQDEELSAKCISYAAREVEARDAETANSLIATPPSAKESYDLRKILALLLTAMKDPHTLKWSAWSAFSLCGNLQVSYYIQLLWQDLINSGGTDGKLYHGFSNGINALLGALCAFCVGYLRMDWTRYGEIVLSATSLAQGILLLYVTFSSCTLVMHYVIYALFKALFHMSTTIASSEIAKSLEADSYSLVFGVNTFMALVEQSAITILVTKVLHADIYTQFVIYGSYFMVLGFTFGVMGTITLNTKRLMPKLSIITDQQ